MTDSMELITLEQVEDVLLHGATLDVVPTDMLQEDMVRRILEAETAEVAFQTFESTPVDEIDGILCDVNGVAWIKSAFPEGAGVFALLDVTVIDTDEHLTVSMGGRTTMASFLWAQRHEAMPIRGAFRKHPSKTNPERRFITFHLAPVKAQQT